MVPQYLIPAPLYYYGTAILRCSRDGTAVPPYYDAVGRVLQQYCGTAVLHYFSTIIPHNNTVMQYYSTIVLSHLGYRDTTALQRYCNTSEPHSTVLAY
jgi:hypothetical protein